MGQSSLILVLMATLTVGILLYNSQTVTTRSDTAVSVKQQEAFARETAIVGLNRVIRTLVDRPDEWAQTGTFAIPETVYDGYGTSATYRVDLHNYRPGSVGAPGLPTIDDTLDVRAVGTFRDRDYTIKATYTKGYTNVGVPPALRSPIVTDRTLDAQGANYIASTVDGRNANIHANNDLSLNGSPSQFVVEGYGTYSGPSASTGRVSFRPEQPIREDGETVFQDAPIYVPPVDLADAAARATVVTTPPSGTFTLSDQTVDLVNGWQGVTGKGTEADPFVWYVNGNLSVSGDVFLFGHVQIIASGNVTISGNSKLSPVLGERGNELPRKQWSKDRIQRWTQDNLPNGSQLLLGAGGNVTLSGNPTLVGQIVANGNVRMNGGGNRMVVGGVAAKGDITMNGNAEIWHATPAGAVIPGYDYEVPTGVFLLDYLEWPDAPGTP